MGVSERRCAYGKAVWQYLPCRCAGGEPSFKIPTLEFEALPPATERSPLGTNVSDLTFESVVLHGAESKVGVPSKRPFARNASTVDTSFIDTRRHAFD